MFMIHEMSRYRKKEIASSVFFFFLQHLQWDFIYFYPLLPPQGQLYMVNFIVMVSQVPAGHSPLPSAPERGTCSGVERSQLIFPAVSYGGPFYCPQDHDHSEDRSVLPTACGPSHSCTSDTRADPDTSSPGDASGPGEPPS